MVMKKTAAATTGKATAAIIDFSNVKDRGNFNPKHIEAGDYAATITKVEQTTAKGDGEPMWLFTIVLDDVPRASYPHYCKLVESQHWKIKALLTAAGINTGQRKVKVDPNKLVGKSIGVGMEDDEYEGRLKSVIVDVFSPDDLHDSDDDAEPEEDDLEEEPTPRKKTKKPAPVEEDDEDEDEEEDEPKKRPAKKKAPVEDDEDEDEDELEIDEL